MTQGYQDDYSISDNPLDLIRYRLKNFLGIRMGQRHWNHFKNYNFSNDNLVKNIQSFSAKYIKCIIELEGLRIR